MSFVSGVTEGSAPAAGHLTGIALGLGAAVLYAASIVVNKKLPEVPAFDKTIVQLGIAAIALLPYVLFTQRGTEQPLTPLTIGLLIVVGIVHTGIAYALYFGSIKDISAQTAALFSYIDPVSAIFLSAIFLHEELTTAGVIGAVLVLGSTLFSEWPFSRKRSV